MRLSILDHAPISKGISSTQTLKNSIDLAKLGDNLGYHRFWIGEHHSSEAYASSAPEILVSYLASQLNNIRLGMGGIMMMHYSPLKIAEVVSTLSTLMDGKIDFGAGRASGGDTASVYALSEGRQPMARNLYEKFENTIRLIGREPSIHDLYQDAFAIPHQAPLPEAWLLGSSGENGIEAGRMGVGYAFSQYLGSALTLDSIDVYRDNFKPSIYLQEPEVIISYTVTTAETKEEAEYLAKPQDIWRMNCEKGILEQTMSPEEAKDYPLTEMDKLAIQQNRRIHLVGDSKEIATKLRDEQSIYHFNEAMIYSVQHSHEKRLNVYKLLAKELMD